jgi:hypothetical protein
MLLPLAIACAVIAPATPIDDVKPVHLERVFRKGERMTYEVRSHLFVEARQLGLQTWMPDNLDLHYRFNKNVLDLLHDGYARVHYLRPTFTQVDGEQYDKPPKTTVEKLNWDILMTVSPINELIDIKDQTPKKPEPPKKPGGGGTLNAMLPAAAGQQGIQQFVGQFLGEIYRLALFVGSLDSALDFSPKLPHDEVKPGDTWKRTATHTPQRLPGGGDRKMAMQRLDYTYTYKGIVESNNQKVHRITAELALDTDLAEFVHDLTGLKSADTGLKTIPMKLKASIDFDLDIATRRTLRAIANSEGGFSVVLTQFQTPVEEQRIKGRTTMRLIEIK